MHLTLGCVQEKINSIIVENGIDWVITSIITYFSVKHATRKYYSKTNIEVAENIMEQGLRALLNLDNNEKLPDNAKVIFVEYKGRYLNFAKKQDDGIEYKFLEKIRKTITSIGGDTMGVSEFRPLNFGVLGIANTLKKPVLFNFKNGDMFKFDSGEFVEIKTQKENDNYLYLSPDGKKIKISSINTVREVMIAVPIEHKSKLIGGVTFDMATGSKTVYQNVESSDSDDVKKEKEENNRKALNEAKRTAKNLINAYFKRKGGNLN